MTREELLDEMERIGKQRGRARFYYMKPHGQVCVLGAAALALGVPKSTLRTASSSPMSIGDKVLEGKAHRAAYEIGEAIKPYWSRLTMAIAQTQGDTSGWKSAMNYLRNHA